MMYRYKIPAIPPSNNKFIGRDVRWEYQSVKNSGRSISRSAADRSRPSLWKGVTVTLTYHFKDKRRRDPDNYSGKMILDGLVRAGIIVDDSFDCIVLQLAAVYDKGGYTEISIEKCTLF